MTTLREDLARVSSLTRAYAPDPGLVLVPGSLEERCANLQEAVSVLLQIVEAILPADSDVSALARLNERRREQQARNGGTPGR